MSKVERAIRYATHAHEGQVRKHSGLPYVVHPVEVMKTLSNWGVTDETILTAAVLHDVIEDTGVTKEQIAYEFGLNVAVMVMECTRPKEQSDKKGKLDFLKSFSEKSEGALLIKLADRKCNVNDFLTAGQYDYVEWYAFQAYPLLNELFEKIKEIHNGYDIHRELGVVEVLAAKFVDKNSDGKMFDGKIGYTTDLDHLLEGENK